MNGKTRKKSKKSTNLSNSQSINFTLNKNEPQDPIFETRNLDVDQSIVSSYIEKNKADPINFGNNENSMGVSNNLESNANFTQMLSENREFSDAINKLRQEINNLRRENRYLQSTQILAEINKEKNEKLKRLEHIDKEMQIIEQKNRDLLNKNFGSEAKALLLAFEVSRLNRVNQDLDEAHRQSRDQLRKKEESSKKLESEVLRLRERVQAMEQESNARVKEINGLKENVQVLTQTNINLGNSINCNLDARKKVDERVNSLQVDNTSLRAKITQLEKLNQQSKSNEVQMEQALKASVESLQMRLNEKEKTLISKVREANTLKEYCKSITFAICNLLISSYKKMEGISSPSILEKGEKAKLKECLSSLEKMVNSIKANVNQGLFETPCSFCNSLYETHNDLMKFFNPKQNISLSNSKKGSLKGSPKSPSEKMTPSIKNKLKLLSPQSGSHNTIHNYDDQRIDLVSTPINSVSAKSRNSSTKKKVQPKTIIYRKSLGGIASSPSKFLVRTPAKQSTSVKRVFQKSQTTLNLAQPDKLSKNYDSPEFQSQKYRSSLSPSKKRIETRYSTLKLSNSKRPPTDHKNGKQQRLRTPNSKMMLNFVSSIQPSPSKIPIYSEQFTLESDKKTDIALPPKPSRALVYAGKINLDLTREEHSVESREFARVKEERRSSVADASNSELISEIKKRIDKGAPHLASNKPIRSESSNKVIKLQPTLKRNETEISTQFLSTAVGGSRTFQASKSQVSLLEKPHNRKRDIFETNENIPLQITRVRDTEEHRYRTQQHHMRPSNVPALKLKKSDFFNNYSPSFQDKSIIQHKESQQLNACTPENRYMSSKKIYRRVLSRGRSKDKLRQINDGKRAWKFSKH